MNHPKPTAPKPLVEYDSELERGGAENQCSRRATTGKGYILKEKSLDFGVLRVAKGFFFSRERVEKKRLEREVFLAHNQTHTLYEIRLRFFFFCCKKRAEFKKIRIELLNEHSKISKCLKYHKKRAL